MGPELWRRKIGDEAWGHVCEGLRRNIVVEEAPDVDFQRVVADVLSAAVEVGFVAPERAPKVSPEGTRVIWPSADDAGTPVLTARGLADYYTRRGYGLFLLRAEHLVMACAGPLLPRLQEVLAAYEEYCAHVGDPALVSRWRGFVGGSSQVLLQEELEAALPNAVKPPVRLTVAGPKG